MSGHAFLSLVVAFMVSLCSTSCQSQHDPDSSTGTLVHAEASASLERACQEQQPIIDMHVHAFLGAPYGMKDFWGIKSSSDREQLFKETYGRFRKYNIVKAVVSGPPEAVEKWKLRDVDSRIIPGIMMNGPKDWKMNPERFEGLVKEGKIQVFGELIPLLSGTKLSDPEWEPCLAICEKYDVPVAVHTGAGPPAAANTWSQHSRLQLGDPYLIEDVIVKYPKLRIYICHSGTEWHEHTLVLMNQYPQLYSDLAGILAGNPLIQRYAREFLANAKEAGCLNRVMYGSDQMIWPHYIERSIEYLDRIEFLSDNDKRDILYNNAARFLRLKE